jgi:N-hydroxyarylamine O-acetyltransferase
MSDDWSVGKLDLDAYLERVGFAGARETSEATLHALYAAHMNTFTFENLGVFLGGVWVDLESIQEKIVFGGRGGYCYEQAQLFGAVLERLGFGVERRLARVGPDGGPATPRTHLTLLARVGQDADQDAGQDVGQGVGQGVGRDISRDADQDTWLVDVGFGSSPPAPLRLPRHRSGGTGPREAGPQEIHGWIYDIAGDEEHGQAVCKLRENQAGDWVTLHRWDDSKLQPVDVVLSNHYTSTHPNSWFTWQPILVRRDKDAIRSLVGRTHTVTRAGHVKTRKELTDAEFAAAVVGEFGLKLTADELDAIVKVPVGKD